MQRWLLNNRHIRKTFIKLILSANVIVLLASFSLFSGCGTGTDSDGDSPKDEKAFEEVRSSLEREEFPDVSFNDLETLVADNTDFGLALYQHIRTEENGNIIFSPYSISTALAMLYAGAANQTASQMAEALHFSLPQEILHRGLNYLSLEMDSRGAGASGSDGGEFRLNISNATWIQPDFNILSAYLDALMINYGAGVNLLDFKSDPEKSRLNINDWVAEQTEDKIIDLFPEGAINIDTQMVLVNTVYFNAAWLNTFDESDTQEDPFYLLDDTTTVVPTMHQTEYLQNSIGDDYQAVSLPYDGNELCMDIIIPDKGQFEAFEASMDAAVISEIITRMAKDNVEISMPKWEYKSKFPLKEKLSTMGMPIAFKPYSADFSGITGQPDLFIQGVEHQAFIKVNESGTEAAAATGGSFGVTAVPSPPVVIKIDRPFIYFIRDIETQTILFVGRVLDPNQ